MAKTPFAIFHLLACRPLHEGVEFSSGEELNATVGHVPSIELDLIARLDNRFANPMQSDSVQAEA